MRGGIFERDVAAGSRNGAQKSAGFDTVGNDRMLRAMQFLDSLDHQAVGADAFDLRAHGHQQIRQIAHFGFARGVFQHGLTVRQRRRHQQIFGPGDGDHVGHDARALQTLRLGVDIAGFDRDIRAHRLQALDVLIDRT